MSSARDHDPRPGDFDAELAAIQADDAQIVDPSGHADVAIQVIVHGDDATRLERVARERGMNPSELVADLLRDADRPAA
jgi:hypothetical protein